MKKLLAPLLAGVLLALPLAASAASDTEIRLPKLREDAQKVEAMVTVTFDVYGPNNAFSAALPLLEKYNLPATIFITTGSMGGTSMPSWTEIKGLANVRVDPKKGDSPLLYDIASRGDIDDNMTKMDDASIAASIAASAWKIASETGTFPVAFTAPWNPGDQRTAAAARKLKLTNVSTSDYGALLGAGQNHLGGLGPSGVSRVMVTDAAKPEEICDQIAWAANDHRWLVIGFSKVLKEPNEKSEWYDVTYDEADLIFDCIATYAASGVIKPVTLRDGLKALPPPKMAAVEE